MIRGGMIQGLQKWLQVQWSSSLRNLCVFAQVCALLLSRQAEAFRLSVIQSVLGRGGGGNLAVGHDGAIVPLHHRPHNVGDGGEHRCLSLSLEQMASFKGFTPREASA